MMKRWLGIMLSVILAAGALQVPVYAVETGATAVEVSVEEEAEDIEITEPQKVGAAEVDIADEETAGDADSMDFATEEADLEDEETLVDIQDQPVVDDLGSEDLGNAEQDIYTGDISDELEDQNGIDTDETDISEEYVERNEVDREEGAVKDSDVSDTHTEQIEEEVDVEQEQKTALAMGTTQPQPYFAYNADILAEADTISGVSYSDIIKFSMNGNWLGNSAEINYNLHGEYSSVSFIAGFMSGSSVNATMKVIADGETLLEQEIAYDKVAKTYSLPMAGVDHLRISFKTSGYDTKYYGIANLSFVSEGNISTHEYTSDEFFDVYNAGVRTNTTTVEDAFEMGGNIYNGGYKMSMNGNWLGHTAKINFNFQNHFKEMSFDLCFISGPRSNLTYTIEADDTVLYDGQTLPYGSIPKQIKLDLTGVSGVVITVKNSEYDTNYCGIGNIQLISDGTPLGIKLNKTSAKLTSKERQVQLTGGVYPSDAQNREYTLRSDNPNVASVDQNGLVTGRSKGTAVIFAESEYVKTPAQCKVTSDILDALWMTIFSNQHLDAGHAFLNIENCTNKDVYIGPYKLSAGDNAYISGRGIVFEWIKDDIPVKKSDGGVFINFESVQDRLVKSKKGENYYRDFSWYTIGITEGDLEKLYQVMESYGTYSLTNNNCTHFATKAWNAIADDANKVPDTGVPGTLKNSIIKLGGKTATELKLDDKEITDILILDSDGDLMPYSLKTEHYANAINSLKITDRTSTSVSLSWDSLLEEIGRNQYNITRIEIEYTEGKNSKIKTLPANYCTTTIGGLKPQTEYTFKIYGVSDHLATKAGIVTGMKTTIPCKATTDRDLPGKTSRGDMFNLANNVKATWKEVPGAKYYKVYRSGIKDPVIVTSALVGYDNVGGLVNGQKYTYKIVASLTGKGDSSGDSKLSYSKVFYRLKTVVIRSVQNTAPGKVTVKYDKTTSGDSYVLQYCERKDMVGAKTKVVLGANNTSYTIGGLKKGKTYYISIRVRKKVNGIDYYTTFGVPKKITITK